MWEQASGYDDDDDDIEYRAGQKNAVADQLSRPVRIIRCQLEERWLGKTKEEFKQMQRDEHKWQ